MKTFNLKIFIITILFVATSCKPNYDKIFNENNKLFELKRNSLNKLIAEIENNYLINWDKQNELILSVDSFKQKTQETLKEIGIGSIEISKNPNENCYKNYFITFNVSHNWNIKTLKEIKLIYAPCDKYSGKNYHYHDGYHRDFWGQGDNWFIYSDTDFI